ncbi:MAG TPA: SIMPL domain-containing protein [bacterium]|nr:SIMPL domain-containing protein [bacterium]
MRALLALLILLLVITPVAAQVPEVGRNQIITHGMGRVEVPPNQASVTIGVQAQRPAAADASAEANRVAEQILNRLQQIGVRRQDIRTSGIQLNPVYTTPREGAPQIVGYRASYTLTLTLTDLRQVGPSIDESVKAGANTIVGVGFGLRDMSEARREALAAAVREAREKADAIARAAGLQIKGIQQIVEEGVEFATPRMEQRALPAPAFPTPIEPGLVMVTARVTMVFNY